MVLAHSIERCVVYFIPSKNTIGTCVVLAHGIGKGSTYKEKKIIVERACKYMGLIEYFSLKYICMEWVTIYW